MLFGISEKPLVQDEVLSLELFGILRIPPFVNHKGKDVNSDSLADQRSVLGHARINKGRAKGDDPEIDTAQTPKRLGGCLALQEKIQKTFADSIPNKESLHYHDHLDTVILQRRF